MPMSTYDERPKTLRSGISLKPKYSVHHRSDMLIIEQIEIVTEKQEVMYNLLTDLDNAKTDEDIERLRSEVQAAKEKSDAALILLSILYKINHELKYARLDLEEALKHTGGDILAARKRVMWLEDRMGTLCGKVRLRGQPVNPRVSHRTRGSTERGGLTLTFRSDSDVSDDDDNQFVGRQKSLPPIHQASGSDSDDDRGRGQGGGRGGMMETPSMSGSEDFQDMQMRRPGMMDTPSSEYSSNASPVKMGFMQQRGPQFSDDSDDEATPPPPPAPPQQEQEQESEQEPEKESEPSQSEGGSEADDRVSELPTMFNKEKREFSGVTRHSPELQVQSKPEIDMEATEEEMEKRETEEPKVSDTEDKEEEVSGEEEPKEEKSEEITEEDGKDEKTFITEVSATTNKSRVTIVSPKREDTRQAFLREISEEERDLIMEYWQSEHHRFEYGEYADVLTQLDPLSYHQMGLAVPGSFLEKYNKEFEELPWNVPENKKKAGDITDIHKRALDKLAVKVHQMYNKIYLATMLSVRPSKKATNGQREVSLLQSIDYSTKESSVVPSLLGVKTATSSSLEGTNRPPSMQTVATVEIPKLETHRLGTSKSGRLVYYPKPIPPPQVLPLTRTTTGKEYPRLADSYLTGQPKEKRRKPAIRIVDQRNLGEETKLTLYRERSKGRVKGPSTTEQKFRMMLAREKSAASSKISDGYARTITGMRMATKMSTDEGDLDSKPNSPTGDDSGSEGVSSIWSKMKPKSRNREYSGLKWERVKSLVHTSLISKRVEERIDAAKHLGMLRCGDAMVFYALKERMKSDEEERVRYEAAKSLILVGCWDEDVQQVILKYLVIGNSEIRLDLICTMIDGKNVQYVDKKTSTFPELVKVLSHYCRNPEPGDPIALESAVLLGRLCVDDENAKSELKRSLKSKTSDTHKKAKSLEILVKQLNCTDQDIVSSILDMIKSSYVWKYRVLATELLITLGIRHVCKDSQMVERVYEILVRRLWDDPTTEVRVASAKALTALGMFRRVCENVEKQLEDPDEDIRSQAVISVGTLGMKNEKINRLLLEMLELDASDYVRLMVVRTFVTLNSTEKRIIRALRERERAEGALGREAKKAVATLEALTQLPPPSPRRSMTPATNNKQGSSMSFLRPVNQSV